MMTPEELKNFLEEAFPGARIAVRDLTGTGDHFGIEVQARDFTGKSLIEQHQTVHSALKPVMDSRIHAVQIKTRAWE